MSAIIVKSKLLAAAITTLAKEERDFQVTTETVVSDILEAYGKNQMAKFFNQDGGDDLEQSE